MSQPESASGGAPPIGVLLANLGTPAAPRAAELRRYLRQFLTDRRVVDLPPVRWRLLLELVILPRRAPRSAEAYASVWTAGGSPLLVNTRKQADALARELGPRFCVRAAMRYGEPSIARAVDELLGEGCERLVLLPAFPQYASATTGSSIEETFRVLSRLRAIPALAVVPPYPTEPGYVDALAERARRATAGRTIDHWVLSFHGIPVRAARGDPYAAQCESTARALAVRLGLAAGSWTLAWQSRFGREAWLEPATDRVVRELAPRARTIAVLVPGFSADCLETLEELGTRAAEDFRAAGGGELVLVPALNDDPAFVHTLRLLVERAAGAPLP